MVALVDRRHMSGDDILCYSLDGRYCCVDSGDDLVNVPEPPRERVMWMPVFDHYFDHNRYHIHGYLYQTLEHAVRAWGDGKDTLCIIPITITDREPDNGEG